MYFYKVSLNSFGDILDNTYLTSNTKYSYIQFEEIIKRLLYKTIKDKGYTEFNYFNKLLSDSGFKITSVTELEINISRI